jgi:acetyl esterase/lipase
MPNALGRADDEENLMTASSSHPPIDPELAAVLATMPEAMRQPLTMDNIGVKRQELLERTSPDDDTLRRGGAVELEERQIPGPAGAPELTALILRPSRAQGPGAAHGAAPQPGVYYIHGGGMVMGDRRTGTAEMASWVEQAGVTVVSVEYRLAPEHPYPAPIDDCYAGLCWMAEHAGELGTDPGRLIITGRSAGGGLAAGVALLARDRGGPALSHQILVCPMLDDRAITPSSHELDREGVWDQNSNLTGWTALLGDASGGPDVPVYAAPAREQDLAGLPPTFIDVGSVETFRDEDIDYAARLSRAGIAVEMHLWPGGFHSFDHTAPLAALSQISTATRLAYLRRAIAG